MKLSALRDFHCVAAAGSLGKASRDSDRPKATISRHIRQLEESLGVRLIERGGRAMSLTADGQALYERTRAPLKDIEEAGRNLASGLDQPSGELRVSAPVLFSTTLGGRLAAEFAMAFPDVRLDWVETDRQVDLVEEGVDVAIRINPHPGSQLVGRCFAHDTMLIVASPRLPMPEARPGNTPVSVPAVTVPSLANLTTWRIDSEGKSRHLLPDYHVRLSSFLMVRDAIRLGAGAGLLPRSLAHTDIANGRLMMWGVYPERTVELWALHNSRRLVNPKVSAFMAFLVDSFPSKQL